MTVLASLQDGSWLTAERLRIVPRILLGVMLIAICGWVALSDGLVDPNGRPLGTDFSNVYAAGELTLQDAPYAAYDPVLQHEAEKKVFGGRDVPFYGWHYPPQFLMVAAVLALLPYGWALLAWMSLTLPAYVAAIRAIAPPAHATQAVTLALAFPAVFINLGHGQNGFLSAALIGGALVMLDRKPVAAGILIGLLAYKPQFGILIPLVLAVSGRWRVFLSAAVTVLASCAATLALFGPNVWRAFLVSTRYTRDVVLEAGGTGWEKIQSLFAALRMWGAGVETAYAGQALLALGVAASLVWLWRGPAPFALKAAGLATGSLLVTPYVLDYDMAVLGVAIAFFAIHGLRHGFRDWEISLLAAAWAVPLIARSLGGALHLPFGLAAMLALYAMTLHRAAHQPVTSKSRRRESLAEA